MLQDLSWKRMIEAVEAVRKRARRAAAAAPQRAGIPYAVAGGNAVAAWVARVDRAAVRNTQDVDILVRRTDFDVVKAALEAVGFVHHHIDVSIASSTVPTEVLAMRSPPRTTQLSRWSRSCG